MNDVPVARQNGADRRAVEALRIQSCHLEQKMPESERISVLFIHFAQSAVFGAFFMQRMCNLGERAKDGVLYFAA